MVIVVTIKKSFHTATRSNYIKAKIDDMLMNSKCKLNGYKDEIVNHIISKYSKLAQKEYKNRHDWVGKVIHWDLCKNDYKRP